MRAVDEARSLTYSINVEANTAQAEANIRNVTSGLGNLQNNGSQININADTSQAESGIRNVTGGLGGLQTQANSVGSAFRSSFLESVDNGNTFASSLKAGVGGAFEYVGSKASEFKNSVVSTAQSIGHGFAHPIETIKGSLGSAIESAKSKFIGFVRGAEEAADATDEIGDSAADARRDMSNLGDSAEKSGGKFEKLGGVLKGVGVAIGAISAVAAAGAVALGAQVVSAGADYEQLVGGIDTLFGGASKEVQRYAADAYKTAGMSANQYMELTTSFSASLIGSLGGDTAKAAKYADQAITDMADNANKMGTGIESIQNAYRGFSMGNYTMLDNLKLGYGGTQDEMQRLLDDAGKLAGITFDISSYADITEAIHIIQTEMGITGTTAKEAAATISGSMASTKSAIGNLIAGLGNADADIGRLVDNVIESFGNVVDNVVPVVENLVGALPSVVDSLIPAIGEMLPKLLGVAETLFGEVLNTLVQLIPELVPVALGAVSTISNTLIVNLPLLIEAAAQIIVSLAIGLGQALPELIPTVIDALFMVVDTIIENLPLILDAGMQIIDGLIEGIIAGIPLLIEQLPELILQIANFLTESLPTILEQGSQMIMTLATGILDTLPDLVAQLPAIITGIVGFITENLPLIIETGISLLVQLGLGMIQAIPQLTAQLPAIISAVVDGLAQLPGMIIEIGGDIVRGLWEGIKGLSGWIWNQISGWASSLWDGICGFFGIHSPSTKFAWAGEMMVDGLAGSISKNGNEAVDAVKGMVKDIGNAMPIEFDLPSINSPEVSTDGTIMPDISYTVSPIVKGVNVPTVSDVYYGVKPMIDDFNPPDVSADAMYSANAQEVSISGAEAIMPDIAYTVSPIVKDVNVPAVSDVYYGVKPMMDDFNPPDASADAVHSANAPEVSAGGAGTMESNVPAFAPVISVQVEGNMDEKAIENLKASLYETVRELFAEFKEEELERMTLKNQYAY